jgi:hypothetical protein
MRFRWLGVPLVCALSFGIFGAGCSQSAPSHEDASKIAKTTQGIQGGVDDGAAHPYAVGV